MMTLQNIVRDLQSDNPLNSNTLLLTLIWIGALFLLFVVPCISTQERRKLCCRRITERRWNLEDNDGNIINGIISAPHANIVRRYPVGDPRHRFTKEEAEEETKKYLINKLAPFTKTIDSSDFVRPADSTKNDFEISQQLQQDQHANDLTMVESSETLHTTSHEDEDEDEEAIANSTRRASIESANSSENLLQKHNENEDENYSESSKTPPMSKKSTHDNDGVDDDDDVEMVQHDPDGYSLVQVKSSDSIIDEAKNPPPLSSSSSSPPIKMSSLRKAFSCKCVDEVGSQSTLLLPGPGVPCDEFAMNPDIELGNKEPEQEQREKCQYGGECSICLNEYVIGDKVSWSGLKCNHAFHQDCIVEWLMTLGKKSNNRAARSSGSQNTVMQGRLCNFDMVCPICRMNFIPNSKGG